MKPKAILSYLLLTPLLWAACQQEARQPKTEEAEVLDIPECVVTTVPDSLNLDTFYTKYVNVNGLPLVSSWRVPDSAFVAAQLILIWCVQLRGHLPHLWQSP